METEAILWSISGNKRRAIIFNNTRKLNGTNPQTPEEKSFLKENKIENEILGYEIAYGVVKEFKFDNEKDLKDIHLYLILIYEYIESYEERMDKFDDLFKTISFTDLILLWWDLIDNIDKAKYLDLFHDIFSKILDILIIVVNDNSDLKKELFSAGNFVVSSTEIYKQLIEAWFEPDCDKASNRESTNKSRMSLARLQNIYCWFSMDSELWDILLKYGNYFDILTSSFVNNSKAISPKIWYYSWIALTYLCSSCPKTVDITDFSVILEEMAMELTSEGEMNRTNMYSLEAILSLLLHYKTEKELKKAVLFVKEKINIIVRVLFTFYSEIEDFPDKFDDFIRSSLELSSMFIEHDWCLHTYDLLHQSVFRGLLFITEKVKFQEKAFGFLAWVFRRVTWEVSKHKESKWIDDILKNPVIAFMNDKIIQRNYIKVFEQGNENIKLQFINLLVELFSYWNEVVTHDYLIEDLGILSTLQKKDNPFGSNNIDGEESFPPIFIFLIEIIERKELLRPMLSSMKLIYQILKFGEGISNEDGINDLAIEFQELRGDKALEDLYNHKNNVIYEASIAILKEFYQEKDGLFNE